MRRQPLSEIDANSRKSVYKRKTLAFGVESMDAISPGSSQDPRDFASKKQKKEILKRLLKVLDKYYHSQHQFTLKKLTSVPLTKDVYKLFEILIRIMDPNFILKSKETDGKTKVDYNSLYTLIQSFNYHGRLKPNDLRSLLPFSWTSTIFVFDLFLQLVEYHEDKVRLDNRQKNQKQEDDFDDDLMDTGDDTEYPNDEGLKVYHNEERERYEHLRVMYTLFMQGMDGPLENYLNQITENARDECDRMDTTIEESRQNIDRKRDVLDVHVKEDESLRDLKKTTKTYQKDLRKIKRKVSEYRRENKNGESRLKSIKVDDESVSMQLDQFASKKNELMQKINTQQMSRDQIIALKTEIERREYEKNAREENLRRKNTKIRATNERVTAKRKRLGEMARAIDAKRRNLAQNANLNLPGVATNLNDNKKTMEVVNNCKSSMVQRNQDLKRKLEELERDIRMNSNSISIEDDDEDRMDLTDDDNNSASSSNMNEEKIRLEMEQGEKIVNNLRMKLGEQRSLNDSQLKLIVDQRALLAGMIRRTMVEVKEITGDVHKQISNFYHSDD